METPTYPVDSTTPELNKPIWKKLVLIVLVIAVLIGGGFFAYKQLSNSASAELLPPALSKYAVGADAEAFLILKNDVTIKDFVKKLQIPDLDIDSFQAGLLLMKTVDEKEIAYGVFQFDTKEAANKAMELLPLMDTDLDFAVEDNILTASFQDSTLQSFTGSLYDNPLLKEIDPNLLDSHLIVYIDNKKLPETNLTSQLINVFLAASPLAKADESSSLIPTANAGLLSAGDDVSSIAEVTISPEKESLMNAVRGLGGFTKSNGAFIKFNEKTIEVVLVDKIMEKDELQNSIYQGFGMEQTEIEKFYDDFLSDIGKSTNYLEEELGKRLKDLPDLKIAVKMNGMNFSISGSASVDILENVTKLIQKSGSNSADSRARDVQKITTLQKYNEGIIVDSLNKGSYPLESKCINEIIKASEHIKDVPINPNTNIEINGITCEIGYYQIIPGKGFILWAKMENLDNGNTKLTPQGIEVNPDISAYDFNESDGQFYVIFFEDEKIGQTSVPENDVTANKISR